MHRRSFIASSARSRRSVLQSLAARSSPTRGIVSSKNGMVITTSAPASDVGAAILRKGRQRDRRRGRHRVRARRDASERRQHRRRRLHGDSPGEGRADHDRLPRARAAQVDADDVSRLDRQDRAAAHGDRLSRARRAGHRSRAVALAHKKFGKLSWKTDVMPAVELAEKGFALSDALARSLNREVSGAMAKYPASVAAYGKPGGGQWKAGDTLVLRDLGRTLRAIATKGPDAFYTGWIADSIAATMAQNGGLITQAGSRARIRRRCARRFAASITATS